MNAYTLVDYIDVWGNSEDGFEVNDVMRYENYITIAENLSDDDIIQALINKGYLAENRDYTLIANDDSFMEIYSGDYPVCALVKEA